MCLWILRTHRCFEDKCRLSSSKSSCSTSLIISEESQDSLLQVVCGGNNMFHLGTCQVEGVTDCIFIAKIISLLSILKSYEL